MFSWTSTREIRDEKRWHFKMLPVSESLQCKLLDVRLLHQESLETNVIFRSAFKCFHRIGLPCISLCNYFCLFAPHLFFLWPVFSLPKLISLFFLTRKKNCKTVSFFWASYCQKTFSLLWHKNKFSMRFLTYAVLLSLMVLNKDLVNWSAECQVLSFVCGAGL